MRGPDARRDVAHFVAAGFGPSWLLAFPFLNGQKDSISSREEEICLSSPKNDRSMTVAALLPSSVESCGGVRECLCQLGVKMCIGLQKERAAIGSRIFDCEVAAILHWHAEAASHILHD